ncbi:MAG: hypothetical protein CMQ19_07215 [Gammaproteobacteria bacterium]|nr:hypothetical protein [Gammaproteobacteria bacterium]|tara:strand:- start:4971 stop:6218 length:1248 start_codon:yes stop_codon:yes gene_type:complete
MLTGDEKVITKYLQKYAEPEVNALPSLPHYDHCLVIPAFDETFKQLERTWHRLQENYLVILVVNSPLKEHAATLRLRQDIASLASSSDPVERCSYIPGNPDILLVDRCTVGNTIPPRQGVGLARKVGADIALRLISEGRVASPRISCTDADAILPENYFAPALTSADAALVFPFVHQPEPGLQLPTLLYDLSIVYYACGLRWSGSTYAYTSLGSTMAISASHYAKVRGFPRRDAAEDFYLLNKLAKTGSIQSLPVQPVHLAGRLSDRVPFGTGAGIGKISGMKNPLDDFHFYHPDTFRLLKELLAALSSTWTEPQALAGSSKEIQTYCEQSGLGELIAQQREKQTKKKVFEKFLHDWFDGFRTVKFVHFMRDHYLPSVPISGLSKAEFIDGFSQADLPELRHQLSKQLFKAVEIG